MTVRLSHCLPTAYCLLLTFLGVSLAGCTNGEEPPGVTGRDPMLYLDYRVSGSEAEEGVTVLLQFRQGSPEGNALNLPEGAFVALDSVELRPDSAGFTGVFYEAQLPLARAAGGHRIVYRAPSGRRFPEDFLYTPFRLPAGADSLQAGQDFVLPVEGLLPEDRLQVALTDTSFWSGDVNEEVEVRNGQLLLPAGLLEQLVPGPLSVQVTKEVVRPLKAAPPAGGDIRIAYSLTREWTLLPPR